MAPVIFVVVSSITIIVVKSITHIDSEILIYCYISIVK